MEFQNLRAIVASRAFLAVLLGAHFALAPQPAYGQWMVLRVIDRSTVLAKTGEQSTIEAGTLVEQLSVATNGDYFVRLNAAISGTLSKQVKVEIVSLQPSSMNSGGLARRVLPSPLLPGPRPPGGVIKRTIDSIGGFNKPLAASILKALSDDESASNCGSVTFPWWRGTTVLPSGRPTELPKLPITPPQEDS